LENEKKIIPTKKKIICHHIHGVGAQSATVAQAAEQTPRDELQARIAAGAAGAATVPNVNPAAA
jgi:hypothetical protein